MPTLDWDTQGMMWGPAYVSYISVIQSVTIYGIPGQMFDINFLSWVYLPSHTRWKQIWWVWSHHRRQAFGHADCLLFSLLFLVVLYLVSYSTQTISYRNGPLFEGMTIARKWTHFRFLLYTVILPVKKCFC